MLSKLVSAMTSRKILKREQPATSIMKRKPPASCTTASLSELKTLNEGQEEAKKGHPFHARWPLGKCRSVAAQKKPAPHQQQALAQLTRWYENQAFKGPKGGILVLPTGGGKTFTAAHFLCTGPLSDGYKVLWLAHTHHLLEQAYHAFSADLLGSIRAPREQLNMRVVSGTPGHFPPRDIKPSDDIVIATLQTITNAHREQLAQLMHFLDAAHDKLFVVFDEAHHSPAPSYSALLVALQQRGAQVLGLTATPTYTDESRQGWLKKLFPQGILAQARTSELIAQRILARPRFEPHSTSIVPEFDEREFNRWQSTYRDIPDNVISHLAKNKERNELIASVYAKDRHRYGKTIIFTDRWYQCDFIAEALAKYGVKTGTVYSHEDAKIATVEGRKKRGRDENAKTIEQFRTGQIDVLVNVRMLTEGTDIPDAQTVFLTRQTTSTILMTQMIGRALRGPLFGGTEEANIVTFIDDWQQAISWAEFEPLTDGPTDEKDAVSRKNAALHLISIELIRRLARQMSSETSVAPVPFSSMVPVGWYQVSFSLCQPDSDESENRQQLIMVFDDEQKGIERFIAGLLKKIPAAFGDEGASFEQLRATLETWQKHYLPSAMRGQGLLLDLFSIARHIAQRNEQPPFFPFEVRQEHDLDALAREFIQRDLGPRAIQERLRAEYDRKDRYWGTLFRRFEQFHSFYRGCEQRILDGDLPAGPLPSPIQAETPSFSEPDEVLKALVKQRDGHRCVACRSAEQLQVDHITSAYRGGPVTLENLQTLCNTCNQKKRTRTINFTSKRTLLRIPNSTLEAFSPPFTTDDSRERWEYYLRRVINFFYECGAVSKVTIGSRGHNYYNWRVELHEGNVPASIGPLLPGLMAEIQGRRTQGKKPQLESLVVSAPGEQDARCGG